MKKKLSLLFLALVATIGAWAASPATGAYPVEGKTYYFYANQYNSTNRYYIYWDNANSVLKHTTANIKENSDYYKWTVTVNDGAYTITNVGTGTKLQWNSGLTLGESGLAFDLSKSVNYTACVSLYANLPGDGPRWCCVKNDTETFANGYKFNAFVSRSDYSIDFVFEEVLPDHSLTDGSFYTIYCDNDSKQYLCTNGSTLTVSGTTPTTASSNCIWKCIANGDNYQFQNLATGQYLGWKVMQSTGYDFKVGTDKVLHDGCATIWGNVSGGRYLNVKVDGSAFDQGSGVFNKVTTDYCSDFRFDAITPTFGSTVADLSSLSNSKAYVITNARGTWNFAGDASSMTAVTGYNLADEAQHIAIINHENNYYLFSVNAGKYLTANNTLTSMPTDNEQVDIVATGNASYPWFFRFKTKNADGKYTNNINISQGNIIIDGWGPGGSNSYGSLDAGNSNVIIEAADFDATAALAMFSFRYVDYTLHWSDGTQIGETVHNVAVTVSGDAADFRPAAFDNEFVTFSYSPSTILSETTEVTVTASWNGPFQISSSYDDAIWQVVQMHTYKYGSSDYAAEKWSWSYKSDDSNKVKPEQVLEYDAVSSDHLFCFIGNPYQGFKIYNAAAGSSYTLNRDGESEELTMTSGDHLFTLHNSATNPDAATYFTLKPSGATNYVNFDYSNKRITGWNDADNGSTCWVVAPGQYYLDFIDGLCLDAPDGAVGTRSYFQNVANAETEKNNLRGCRTAIESSMYSNELSSLNSYLNPIKGSDIITLADGGYYRVISAVPGFGQAAAWYYNPATSSDHITWAKAATTQEQQVNSIFMFKASEGNWNIYSPNAEKWLIHDDTAFGAQTGTLGDEAGTVYINSIGAAQHTLRINVQTIHANGHNSGNGTAGTLINWNANDAGAASTWYIVKVDDVSLTLNAGGDGNYYATAYLPFDATVAGATAYTLALNGAETALTMTELTDGKVPAGTPVFMKGIAGTATVTINTGDAFAAVEKGDLTGTYTDLAVTGGTDYFLGKVDGKVGFYHWDGSTLKANRAYFEASKLSSTGAKGFALDFEDDATGIDDVNANLNDSGNLNEAIYNLAGQRLNKMQKGINIINGKKILK